MYSNNQYTNLRNKTNPLANSLMYEIYALMPNGSDLTVFKNAGYSGLYLLPLLKYFGDINLDSIKSEDNAIYFNVLGRNRC